MTDANGDYTITGLGAGTYTVAEELQPGWEQTYPGGITPSAFAWDNGPLVNGVGTGVGGADESVLQSLTLGMNSLGMGHQVLNSNRVADDFTITAGDSGVIDEITFYAYQSGSTTTSTMTALNYQIWDGSPDVPASSVVFGDTTTNRLTASTWSNIYRVTETTTGSATDRPIMANTVSAGVTLPPGTYWLDWQTDGTLGSGPWLRRSPSTGRRRPGNALHFTSSTSSWGPALDSGTSTPQDFPFIIGAAPDFPLIGDNSGAPVVNPSAEAIVSGRTDAEVLEDGRC